MLGCVAFAAAVPLLAQTYHGGLRGAVRESGGVVSGALVTMVNEANGTERSTSTNAAGEYAFVQVEPGDYTVKVSMQGFKTIEHKKVHIGTQQFITMDHALEVGSLAEAVTVEGAGIALETSNASQGSTLDSKTLELVPTAGRNPFFLATITPGVTHTGDPQFIRQQDQTNSSLLSLGGGPRRGNNYTLDGVAIVDMRNRATVIPSIEAVEEVKVQVTTYDAEMGRTGGGVFNMTGKSGANAWHGSLLGQTRPGFARSQNFFSRQACEDGTGSCEKPDTYYYLYAGSLGGPIVKNKTFFWMSVEGYKSNTIDEATVRAPNERELNGDFTQSGITVYDPLTTRPDPAHPGQFIRDPFPGNVIPANRISPVAQNMRQYWPQAGTANAELVDRSITGTFKLDQVWSPNFRTSAMYAIYDSTEPQPRSYLADGATQDIGANPADPGDGALYRQVHAIAVNNTITPNQTTVAHVRAGLHQLRRRLRAGRVRPGHARLLAELRQPDSREEVPVLRHRHVRHGLQRLHVRRPPHQRPHLLLVGRQCLDVQAPGRAHGQVRRVLPQDRGEELQSQPIGRTVLLRRPVHERRSAEPGRRRSQRAGRVPARIPLERRDPRVGADQRLHQLLRGLRPGRLPGQLEADPQRGPALRVRAGPPGKGQPDHRRLRP